MSDRDKVMYRMRFDNGQYSKLYSRRGDALREAEPRTVIEEVSLTVVSEAEKLSFMTPEDRTRWFKSNFSKLTPVEIVKYKKLGWLEFMKVTDSSLYFVKAQS